MRRVTKIALAVTAAALGVTSCGGSDDAAEPARPPTETETESSAVDSAADISGAPDGVVDFGEFSRDHVGTNVEYEQTPPVGGPHLPIWQTCNFYDAPIPSERGVHSLEHGAVWITYAPDLDADQVAIIEGLADGEREVLATPFDGLPSSVVASAWGVQIQLDAATDTRLEQFVDFYENGPQTPEPNTPCAGGESSTI